MKIKIEEALKIKEHYGDLVPLLYAKDIYLIDKITKTEIRFFQGMAFDFDHYEVFSRNNINQIEVVFSDILFAKLISSFPDRYRLPLYVKNFLDFDRYISSIDDANRLSKRKRHVISATEISGKSGIIIEYGEIITFEKWNKLKSYIDRKSEIGFYSSERGILIVTLMEANQSNYLQKFFLHSEAVTLFVEKLNKMNIPIAPDFYPETDVSTATKEEEVMNKYINNNIRLVVIVDTNIDERYKNLIVKLRTYDRFVRLSAITDLNPMKEEDIAKAISKAYLSEPFLEIK
ncbi:MAG: hypothetical protein ACP5PT_02010 [Brevinematia bacterium]